MFSFMTGGKIHAEYVVHRVKNNLYSIALNVSLVISFENVQTINKL